MVASVANFDLSGLSEAASRIKNAISRNDADQQINEYEDDDGDTMRKTLAGTLVTVMTRWMKQQAQLALRQMIQKFLNSLMATWKTLMRPHLKCTRQQVEVFKKYVSFCLVSRVPEAIFLVVGVGAFDGLAQPSNDRKPAKSRDKGKKGKRKGKSSLQKGRKPTNLGTPGILPKPRTSRSESRSPMSKKRSTEVGASRGGPHHAPRLRPDQCMLCRQVRHRASECPKKGKTTACSPGNRAFDTHALGCAVFDAPCFGATFEENQQDQDEMTSMIFVAFSLKSLEVFAILDGGATKTVSGLMNIQPAAIRGHRH